MRRAPDVRALTLATAAERLTAAGIPFAVLATDPRPGDRRQPAPTWRVLAQRREPGGHCTLVAAPEMDFAAAAESAGKRGSDGEGPAGGP